MVQVVQHSADAATPTTRTEVKEVFSPDGTIDTASVKVPVPKTNARTLAASVEAMVYTFKNSGPSDKRFDIAFVGEGYTAGEQSLFHRQLRTTWAKLVSYEPFKTLEPKFNVWVVDAISKESGIDNDPQGVKKDTALNGGYYCGNLARLICVDTAITKEYAKLAPGADQVIVLTNSATYGGSGDDGTGISVVAGGNTAAGDIVPHELGHSLGGLADEYGGSTGNYPQREPSEPNITTMTPDQMRQKEAKWYKIIGDPTPDGGTIGFYEGADYYDAKVWRASENSMMRTLGKEFNTIGIQEITAGVNARTID